jgi:Fe-S oxidoreductase
VKGNYLYHAPCHDSLKGKGSGLLRQLDISVSTTPNCCSEAGTMAISRPDISTAMRNKKRQSIQGRLTGNPVPKTILTNCPSCISGLGRNSDMGIAPLHIAEFLAQAGGGELWNLELETLLKKFEKITI